MITPYIILLVALTIMAKKDWKKALKIGAIGLPGMFVMSLITSDIPPFPALKVGIALLVGVLFIVLTLEVIGK